VILSQKTGPATLRSSKKAQGAILVICLSVLVGLPVGTSAQTPAIAGQSSRDDFQMVDKSKEFTTAELLARFEAAGASGYSFGEGDELTVDVWEHPELSGKHVIGPDGKITLPHVGIVGIAGRSREEGSGLIADAFARFYKDLAVTVRVDRYTSNHISILGRVAHPGVLDFETLPTLLEAITRAGGLPIGGIGAEKAALARCAVFRGRDQLVWIELKNLLTGKDLSLNIRLARGDVIYIPDSDDQLVYVLGEVRTPGAFRLTPNMTFMDALALAGGPTKDGAATKLQLVRPNRGITKLINLDLLLKGTRESSISLNEGDIIYVPRRGLAKVGYVLDKIAPFASYMFFATTLAK
jgi:polysaccharide export outer membrane protein